MELSFVTSALRRYWWVVVGMAILGMIPGLLTGGSDGPPEYESRAVMLVSAPSSSGAGGSDADRYLAGQLSVLRSEKLADDAAELLDDGSTGGDVGPNVSIQREPQTDVVTIVASHPSPERAQDMAQAYVEAYRATVLQRVANAQEARLVQLNEQSATKQEEIDEISRTIDEAVAAAGPGATAEQVARLAVNRLDTAQEEISDLISARTALETEQTQTGVELVQDASLPTEPVSTPPNTLLVIGFIGGALLGVVGAVVLARLSPNVIGDLQVEEILGQAVVGTVPAINRSGTDLVAAVPPRATEVVEALCVRAEAMGRDVTTPTVVVVGTERGIGTTLVSAMVARRFADTGARALLVDADPRPPDLAQVIAGGGGPVGHDPLAGPIGHETRVPGLNVIGLGEIEVPLRTASVRPSISERLHAAAASSDVVVFDGGPLMDAASTLHLSRAADAVILVMSTRQKVQRLDLVASELRGRPVLPVWSQAGSRRLLSRIFGRFRRPPKAHERPPQLPPVPPVEAEGSRDPAPVAGPT
jgi:capsular polysaccharide biosynthesis protein